MIQTNTLLDIEVNGGRITHNDSCFHRMKRRDCWMGDAWISSGFGEWAGRIVPTILWTLITFEMAMIIMWLVALVWWTLNWWWMVCGTKRVTCLSVISWRSVEERRCLFVRGGWSEYFLWLWRHSCTRMPLEDTHRWDWACLNIIPYGWESLSRVMWRGQLNVSLQRWVVLIVLSVVSLGKSSQSIHIPAITSHDQCGWTTILESECTSTHLNGNQFRQV